MKATKTTIKVVVVGPPPDITSGSLHRPMNIYYSLKGLRYVEAKYVPIRTIRNFARNIWKILRSNIIIVSGVEDPRLSAALVVLARVLNKRIIADFHGFMWLEANVYDAPRSMRAWILISEKILYKFSHYVTVASEWLRNMLSAYYGARKNIFVIENAVPYLFEFTVSKLVYRFNINELREYVCKKCSIKECSNKTLILAPLPSWFKSNILAYETLLKLNYCDNVLVIVTGTREVGSGKLNVIEVGYVGYLDYVILLLSANYIILPYPTNAICGGIRTKVLEAGYARKPLISTKAGVIFLHEAEPHKHYVPIEKSNILCENSAFDKIANNLHTLIMKKYSFMRFKRKILSLIKRILK